ncbi:DUF4012 domain-containing protein [Candidatus Uhrbacteria bacterium]|nr:DUF4012 domain-containing protein [Candidatus Uhrbacteria bacterium]
MPHSQEYLERIEPDAMRHHRARARTTRLFFVFTAVAVAFWMLAVIVSAVWVFDRTLTARDGLLATHEQALAFSFDEASASLRDSQDSLAQAQRFLPVLVSARWMPFLGSRVEAFTRVIRSGHDTIAALAPLFDLGSDLIQLSGLSQEYLKQMQDGLVPGVTFGDLSTQTKRAILQRLSASADDLELLSAQMAIIEDELSVLVREMPSDLVRSITLPLLSELNRVGSEVKLVGSFARLLPAFAGLDTQATTLLLFLNNEELRPGGGFIGSYGVLKTFGGDIAELETEDVYALDDAAAGKITPLIAPLPLQRYNGATKWFFRDSNWSPDFVVSSQAAVQLFLEEIGFLETSASPQIDNVIALTPTYASQLLAITGPIVVGGQTFTSENVADALEYQVEHGYAAQGLPPAQRKEILADLVNEMKARLYALGSEQWPLVVEATRLALQEKQLLLFSTNETTQDVITQLGWGGAVNPLTVDALMVVDANLASLKSDPAVEREITYTITPQVSGDWVGTVSILYKHTGTFDWKTTRYRTYTRVYLPIGTELLGVEGSWLNDKLQNPTGAPGPVDVMDELGLRSFGTFTSIEPGDEHALTFTFALSPEVVSAIEAGDYALSVIKQPGAQNNALTLDLDFGKNVTRATPPEEAGEWGDDRYRLNTILDQDFDVSVQ